MDSIRGGSMRGVVLEVGLELQSTGRVGGSYSSSREML